MQRTSEPRRIPEQLRIPPEPIRPASIEDLDEIWALNRKAFPEAWRRASLADAILGEMDVFVWREGPGPLLAYWISQDVLDETHILQLAVAPEVRRRGIASRFARRMLERKREAGVRTVWLEVRASNLAAQRLYRSLGFAEAGRRAGYYAPVAPGGRREDALVMRLDLDADRSPAVDSR